MSGSPSRFTDFFTEASRSRQITLVLGLCLILFFILISAYYAMRPNYQVLFSDLKSSDANAIVAELEKQKVPYQLDETPTGNVVLVPGGDMRGMRLKLMKGDLRLSGVVGLELFNNSDLGLTEFAQKVNYQRALQGELARTIMTLDEIDQARVHLTLPESSLFRRDGGHPKASVALFMRGGYTLEPNTIKGIQRLVAAAVPELSASDVTVLDQRGALAGDKSGSSIDDPKFALKQALEHSYEQKILAQITPIVGDAVGSVSVDAAINYDQAKMTRETGRTEPVFEDGSKDGLNITVPQSKSALLAGLPKPNGVTGSKNAGTLPPLSALVAPAAADGTKSYHEIEQIISAPGTVKRLSVGIVLKKALSPQDLSRLNAVISASIGLDATRGDVLNTFVMDENVVAQKSATTSINSSVGGVAQPVFDEKQTDKKTQADPAFGNPERRLTLNRFLIGIGKELESIAPRNPLTYAARRLGLRGNSIASFSGFMVVSASLLIVVVMTFFLLLLILRKRHHRPAMRQLTAEQRQEYIERLRLLIAAPEAKNVSV